MQECPTPSELERYAHQELDALTCDRFERHLEACARCRAVQEALRAGKTWLVDLDRLLNHPARTEPATQIAPHAQTETVAEPAPSADAARCERLPHIEGYHVKRIIGRGGMGVVYEAVQENLRRPVALKLLPAVVSTSHPELVTRFQREAEAAGRLHHMNIIPVYDFGMSPDGYYYAMELIDGLPLNKVLKRLASLDLQAVTSTDLAVLLTIPDEPLVPANAEALAREPSSDSSGTAAGTKGRMYYRQVARWIADAADALHYAHTQGMIHRDVKPSNLMLCRDGRIVIVDFGLVKTVDELSVTVTGSLVGTYRYMSPEQVGAKRIRVDARTDIYSLGAALYELLTFRPAFQAADQAELLSQILFKEPTPPRKMAPSVPIDLQTICLSCLEKPPAARYQTAQEMAADLRRYLNNNAIVARRPGMLRRTGKFVRRHPVVVISTAAVLLFGVAAAGVKRYVRDYLRHKTQQTEAMFRQLGAAAWQSGEWKSAADAFQKSVTLGGVFGETLDPVPLINVASVYADQARAQRRPELRVEAEKLLKRALEVDRDKRFANKAWNVLGVLYQDERRFAEALDAYEKARELSPNFYATWTNLGTVHALKGDFARAAAALQKAVELANQDIATMPADKREIMLPWHLMPGRQLAAVQLYLREPAAAQTLTATRQLAADKDPATLILSALYYLARPTPDDARTALESARAAAALLCQADFSGTQEVVRRTQRVLAAACLRNQQWGAAQAAARRALAAGDQPAFDHFMLAVASARLGDVAAARGHFQEAEGAWPDELKDAEFMTLDDGASLWIDTRAEWEALRNEARGLIEPADTAPSAER